MTTRPPTPEARSLFHLLLLLDGWEAEHNGSLTSVESTPPTVESNKSSLFFAVNIIREAGRYWLQRDFGVEIRFSDPAGVASSRVWLAPAGQSRAESIASAQDFIDIVALAQATVDGASITSAAVAQGLSPHLLTQDSSSVDMVRGLRENVSWSGTLSTKAELTEAAVNAAIGQVVSRAIEWFAGKVGLAIDLAQQDESDLLTMFGALTLYLEASDTNGNTGFGQVIFSDLLSETIYTGWHRVMDWASSPQDARCRQHPPRNRVAHRDRDTMLWDMSEEDWDQVSDVDLKGAWNHLHTAAAHSRVQASGRVIDIAPINGIRGRAGQTNHAVAKGGLIAPSRSVALELARSNVTVNAVAPGSIATDQTDAMPEAARASALADIRLGRAGIALDVAHAVAFLASGLAAHIIDQVLRADAGNSPEPDPVHPPASWARGPSPGGTTTASRVLTWRSRAPSAASPTPSASTTAPPRSGSHPSRAAASGASSTSQTDLHTAIRPSMVPTTCAASSCSTTPDTPSTPRPTGADPMSGGWWTRTGWARTSSSTSMGTTCRVWWTRTSTA